MTTHRVKMTIPELLRVADNTINNIRRDAEIMAGYGIGPTEINSLEADKNLLKETPTEEELQSVASELVRSKDQQAELVRIAIRSFMVRAKNVFGPDSAEVKGFGASKLSQLSDDQLIRAGRAVKRMSINKLDKLALKGLTAAMIDEFGQQVQALDDLIDDVNEADKARREGTATRNNLALKVYNVLIEFFDYGKDYWTGKDNLKYADYVMFDSPTVAKPVAGMGMVHGNVTDTATGEAITDAKVELLGTDINVLTDEDGDYQGEAPANTYTLKCTAAGMKPIEKPNVEIAEGDDTACDFELMPA